MIAIILLWIAGASVLAWIGYAGWSRPSIRP
jgi:threonine/homoserine/homoserine lactone efflux protein